MKGEKKLLDFHETARLLGEHLGLGRDAVRRFMKRYGVKIGRKFFVHRSIIEGLLDEGRLPGEEGNA